MTTIKQEILDRLTKDVKAKSRIAYEFGVTTRTVDRWLDDEGNKMMLMTPMALKAISEELEVLESEILTEA